MECFFQVWNSDLKLVFQLYQSVNHIFRKICLYLRNHLFAAHLQLPCTCGYLGDELHEWKDVLYAYICKPIYSFKNRQLSNLATEHMNFFCDPNYFTCFKFFECCYIPPPEEKQGKKSLEESLTVFSCFNSDTLSLFKHIFNTTGRKKKEKKTL